MKIQTFGGRRTLPTGGSSFLVLFLLAVGIGSAVGYALWLAPVRLWNGDSASYVDWYPIRTPGYPTFLAAVSLVSPAFGALRFAQSACFLLATVFLCWSVAALAPSRRLVIGLGCCLLLFPPFWQRAGEIRPEIVFISLTELCFGASALALATQRRRWALLAGATLGLAILVRPIGYALLAGLSLVAAAVWRRQGPRAAAALLAPLFVVLAGTCVANGVFRGYYATQAFGGVLFLGKVAPLLPAGGFGDPISAELAEALDGLHEEVANARGPALFWISQQTYTPVLWDRLMPLMAASRGASVVAWDRAASRVARQALAREPLLYARLVAVHFESMWTWPWITTADRIAPIRALLGGPRLKDLLSADGKLHDFVELLVPEWAFLAKAAALAGVFVVCLLLPLAALADGLVDPLLVLAAAAAVSVQAYDGIVAIIDIAIGRFTLPLLPLLGLALVLGVPRLARALRRPATC
jgi:hypothetical protein